MLYMYILYTYIYIIIILLSLVFSYSIIRKWTFPHKTIVLRHILKPTENKIPTLFYNPN